MKKKLFIITIPVIIILAVLIVFFVLTGQTSPAMEDFKVYDDNGNIIWNNVMGANYDSRQNSNSARLVFINKIKINDDITKLVAALNKEYVYFEDEEKRTFSQFIYDTQKANGDAVIIYSVLFANGKAYRVEEIHKIKNDVEYMCSMTFDVRFGKIAAISIMSTKYDSHWKNFSY